MSANANIVKLALPKGRMKEGVFTLLKAAGIKVSLGSREYRPGISLPDFEVKVLKPQNIVEMLHIGSRDIGFAGADWVRELGADLVELLDTEMDPVRIVAAAPDNLLTNGKLPSTHMIIASEYQVLGNEWIKKLGLNATLVRSYGATEVFPPEDADCIIDNTATGSTLRANNLTIVDELMRSSTRLYAHPRSLENPVKREAAEKLVLLLSSVLEARKRVMVELNVSKENVESVISVIPCMREHTMAALHNDAGFAVRAAIPRKDLAAIIPEIKARGGTDIVVTEISNIIP